LRAPILFVSGTRDAFGSIEELASAIKLIPAPTKLVAIEGAGHALLQKSKREELPENAVQEFARFFSHSK
jgi:predicted alpha/beta-hydrolase family hydrolase